MAELGGKGKTWNWLTFIADGLLCKLIRANQTVGTVWAGGCLLTFAACYLSLSLSLFLSFSLFLCLLNASKLKINIPSRRFVRRFVLILRVLVKVRQINIGHDGTYERRWHCSFLQLLPLEAPEPARKNGSKWAFLYVCKHNNGKSNKFTAALYITATLQQAHLRMVLNVGYTVLAVPQPFGRRLSAEALNQHLCLLGYAGR